MNLHKRCILSIQNISQLINISVKCIWQISNEVIEYQDLYRNKDHIRKKQITKKICSFNSKKIVYFISISVKCIFLQIYDDIKED